MDPAGLHSITEMVLMELQTPCTLPNRHCQLPKRCFIFTQEASPFKKVHTSWMLADITVVIEGGLKKEAITTEMKK